MTCPGFRVDFTLFDEDGDGVVTEEEGVRALRACGLCMAKSDLLQCLNELSINRECLNRLNRTCLRTLPSLVYQLIREWFCISGDGKVTFQQFLTILAIKLKHQPPDEEKEELKEAFMVRMSFNRV